MNVNKQKRIHVLGIGGVSTSALAKHYLRKGYFVSGEDICENEYTEELKKLGVKFENDLNADEIVYSSAIGKDVLDRAREKGIPILSRAEAWGKVMEECDTTIGVAGSHGKTTTSAMLSHIFFVAGKKFTCHIGGNDRFFGNYANYGTEYFITEACEYKRNFLSMIPKIALLLNIEAEHMDCYKDEVELRDSFFTFCNSAKKCIVPFGTPLEGVTYGYKNGDYRATHIVGRKGKYTFCFCHGESKTRVRLSVIGKHNVWNALAAGSVASECGISDEDIRIGLERFLPVKRRFEKLGYFKGAEVIADYAHHPSELVATIHAAKQRAKKRVLVVFQPHTYSRTRYFLEEFSEILQGAIIYKTYSAREEFDEEGSAKTLSDHTKNSRYADSERELVSLLKGMVRKRDTILFLGAGDIYEIAKRIIS